MNNIMKSLAIVVMFVACAVAADEKSGRPEKRQIVPSSYNGADVAQRSPAAGNGVPPATAAGNGVPPATAPYQPSYLPVCVLQPYNGNPIYVGPPSPVPAYQPAYQPAEQPYVPQYQPAQYQPAQYQPVAYQPEQYRPAQYQPAVVYRPAVYRPQQAQSPAPYSYSYFTASNDAPAAVQPSDK